MLWLPKASAACSVGNSSLVFGSINTLTDNTVDSTGTITVTCDVSTPYTIVLSPGGSGTYSPRRMASGGNTLDYNLYRDSGYSQIWGDGTGGSYTIADSVSKDYTVYGRIALSTQRDAMVGSYSDSIIVTVTY